MDAGDTMSMMETHLSSVGHERGDLTHHLSKLPLPETHSKHRLVYFLKYDCYFVFLNILFLETYC